MQEILGLPRKRIGGIFGSDGNGINFRTCDNTFDKLFDEAEFEKEMKAACMEIERFLVNWEML